VAAPACAGTGEPGGNHYERPASAGLGAGAAAPRDARLTAAVVTGVSRLGSSRDVAAGFVRGFVQPRAGGVSARDTHDLANAADAGPVRVGRVDRGAVLAGQPQ